MKSKSLSHIIFLITVFFLFLGSADAQKDPKDSVERKLAEIKDTMKFSTAVELMRENGERVIQQAIVENNEKRIHSLQLALLDALEREVTKAGEVLKRGIDTAQINLETNKIEEQFRITSEGIFSDTGGLQTMRNLNASELLMKELITRLNGNKDRAAGYLEQLTPFRNKIDSLQNDTLLLKFSQDSTLFMTYWTKLLEVVVRLAPVDSSLTAIIRTLRESEVTIDNLNGKISSTIEQIEESKRSLARNFYSRELNDLYVQRESKESFSEKVRFSVTRASLVFNYYVLNNLWKVSFLLIAFIFLTVFIFKVRKRYKPNDRSETSYVTDIVFRFPVFTSAFLCLTILQLIFSQPPVVFSGLLWTLSTILLTIILWRSFSGIQRAHWLYFMAAFLTTLVVDLMLKESQPERWLMFLLSVSGIIAGIIVIRNNVLDKRNRTIKLILLSISIFLLAGSAISNFFGRYNLSKIYLTLCFFALLTAYLLYWASILSTQLIEASADAYSSEGNQNFREKVQRLKERIPVYLKYILFISWIILVARNFYFYDRMTSDLMNFMEEETAIGDFTFSFEKLLLFVFIVFLSTLISKVVSFYADRSDGYSGGSGKTDSRSGGLSNWLLLIRIAVISLGTILAFAATGFPMDKLTIIIGSLGVGIGLGLQTIVNNLVSGILLAFEKPFKIGDFIEVSNESGRIKEIGIRSSKLSTSDGADIIIPNGDLLSKYVINWTLRNSLKRSELHLKVKYGTHLNDIAEILEKIMADNERIDKSQPPKVLLHEFGSGSAEYRLLYWTNIEWEDEVKSELIVAIDDEMKKANIELE